jgi:uncharacterized membrane protein YebE (DUF533 family)
MNLKTALIGSTLAIAAFGAFAQSTATPAADQRSSNQEKRIEQGVNSGSLTPTEANRMQRQQKVVGKMESNAAADGTVTKAEKAKINKVQKRTSKDIAKQKHDAQTN